MYGKRQKVGELKLIMSNKKLLLGAAICNLVFFLIELGGLIIIVPMYAVEKDDYWYDKENEIEGDCKSCWKYY